MRSLSFTAVLAVLLLSPAPAASEVVPTPGSASLPDLFDAASLVFAGQVLSVDAGSEVEGKWNDREVRMTQYVATAGADRIYKGSLNISSINIIYLRPNASVCTVSRCESLTPGEHGLFFLRKMADGFHLIDQFFGVFSVSRLKSQANANSGIASLQSDLIAGLHDHDENRLLANIELLSSSNEPNTASPLLDLLTNNRDETIAAAVYSALLRLENYSRLSESLSFAESSPGQSARTLRFMDQFCDLVGAIRDPTTALTLMAFSRSKSDRLRESVVHALRGLGDPRAVPTLIDALGDQNASIRYDAVMGLATVEKNWS